MLKRVTLWIMALFYVAAGLRHFTHPGFYMQLMPPYLPAHLPLVYISGVVEIALGVALVIPKLTRVAAWGVVALLIAVFPANIYMWTADVHIDGQPTPAWFHAIRLPFQALFIAWAYWYTKGAPPLKEPATRVLA